MYIIIKCNKGIPPNVWERSFLLKPLACTFSYYFATPFCVASLMHCIMLPTPFLWHWYYALPGTFTLYHDVWQWFLVWEQAIMLPAAHCSHMKYSAVASMYDRDAVSLCVTGCSQDSWVGILHWIGGHWTPEVQCYTHIFISLSSLCTDSLYSLFTPQVRGGRDRRRKRRRRTEREWENSRHHIILVRL